METLEIQAPTAEALLLNGPGAAPEGLPAWFCEMRTRAWQRFQALPMPLRTDQAWRFTDLKRLDLATFCAPMEADSGTTFETLSEGVENFAARMVFANDQVVATVPLSEELRAKGVIFCPIRQALSEHSEIFRKHFMVHDATLGGAKFAALHQAFVLSGTFLYVPKNVEIALPIEVFHWLSGANASTFPHTLLVAEANSRVTLVDYFRSGDDSEAGFACAVNDLYIGPGAKVNYVCAQEWGPKVLSLQINSTTVERDANVTGLTLNLGSQYARTESVSHLTGTGARSDMLALSAATGTQQFDMRTLQDHLAPGTLSDLLYKNALADSSQTIFAGLIRVEPGAHRTDAYQTNRNLLLSNDAEANSMPGLEILADDVKCSHGATTAQLSDEEMFYLSARGIPSSAAKKLLVEGFLGEVLDRLDDKSVAAKMRTRVMEHAGTRA